MKFYVSRTHVFINEAGKVDGYETVLTKPDSHKPTREMHRRMKALGIPKTRAMTMADVAGDLAELEKEAAEKEANNS